MLVVGVTGLPCAGKSFAARLLAQIAGGEIIQADSLGHAVLARPEVERRLRERLGPEAVAGGDPAETRRRLAVLVFADPEKLTWLEGLVHPLVAEETERRMERLASRRRPAIVEAALLLAAGMERHCNRIALIRADDAVRLARAGRRGWNREALHRRDARLAPQFSPGRLAGLGDRLTTFRNDADDDGLAASIAAAWESWRRVVRE